MDAGQPGIWNQLRFNTDQPPLLTNLVSHSTSRRPGPVVLGPDPQRPFAFVDPATLAIAQRLARRDVQRIRQSHDGPAAPERSRARAADAQRGRRSPSRSPSPPERPAPSVPRLCRRERLLQQQAEGRDARSREEQRQHRRALPNPPKAKTGSVKAAKPPVAFQVPLSDLPARGDSPPVRDTDPQPQYGPKSKPPARRQPPAPKPPVVSALQKEQLSQAQMEMKELRAQHQELLAALREMAKAQSAARASPTPSDRSQHTSAPPQPPRPRLQTHRIKLWGANRPAKTKRQTQAQSARRQEPAHRPPAVEEAEEEAIQPIRAPRPLNELPSGARFTRPNGAAEEVLEEVRRLLMERRAKEEEAPSRQDHLADWVMDEVARDAAEEMLRAEGADSPDLPGHGGLRAASETPTLDEMAFRLQQIEVDTDAIRNRWRSVQYEEVEEVASSVGEEPVPIVPQGRPLLFTKKPPAALSAGARLAEERKRVPHPPTTVPMSVTRASTRSIISARDRFLDWNSDRPLPKFSVELPRVADWLADDLVEELLTAAVSDIDHAGEEIVHLLFDGEMAADDATEEEASLEDAPVSPDDDSEPEE